MTLRTTPFVLGAALLAAAWLRLDALGRESLWLDELFTVRAASRGSWTELFTELAGDVHPPLWFMLLHLVPEGGDAGWRIPSALVGLVGVAVAALLARRLAGGGVLGERAMALAAGLCATAPGLVLLDREARANAALSAATLGLVTLALRPGGWPARLGLGLLAAALVNLHPFGAFVLIGLALYLWLDPGDGTQLSARGGLLVGLVGGVALLPWGSTLLGQAQHFAAAPWYSVPPGDSLGWIFTELADNQPGFLALPALGLALAARQEGPGERRGLLLVVAFAASLVLLPQALSYLAFPVLRARSALPLLPLVLVAAAVGLARAGRLGTALGGLACGAQLLASAHATHQEWRMEAWREAAAVVAAQAGPGEVVLANHTQLWRTYLPDHFRLLDPDAPDLDAAPGAWLLLAHDLEVAAEAPGPVREAATRSPHPAAHEADLVGARVRRVAAWSRDLPLTSVDAATGSTNGTTASLWGAGAVETAPLRAQGDCAVALRAREDAAGTEPARLRVRLRRGADTLLDETLPVGPAEVLTARSPALVADAAHPPVTVRVDFVNDAVIDGKDRNTWIDALRLDCR